MSEEKPLHVRVAEALGAHCHYTKPTDPCVTCGNEGPPGGWELTGWGHGIDFDPEEFDKEVPRYDTDWSATGPLIEKYEITVGVNAQHRVKADSGWLAVGEPMMALDQIGACTGDRYADGPATAGSTPLIAVCNLILALHAAGKLP